MMRVFELVDSLGQGGMESQLVSLYPRLLRRGIELNFCCLRRAGELAQRLPEGARLVSLEKPPGFHWRTVSEVGRQIRAWDCRIVHTHNLGPLIYGALATWVRGRARIVHGEHSQPAPWERTFKRRWQRQILYRRCAAVHTVSRDLARQMDEAGFKHAAMTAIPNGVDTDRFQPAADRSEVRGRLGYHDDDLVVGLVGRFGPYKRHLELIEAFEGLAPRFPNLKLLLVGDQGPLRDAVLARIAGSPCQHVIHKAGFQPEPAPCYQAMDLLVVPSENEGMSNATLEAIACGVPVLSNAVCGASEILESRHGAGWVKPMPGVAEIRSELAHVLNLGAQALKTHGRAARQIAVCEFSMEHAADAYAELFRKAAPTT